MTDAIIKENEMICEKLLGWVKRPSDIPGISFSGWCAPNGPDESTPSFTTWAEAGLILEALDQEGIAWALENSPDPDYGFVIDSHARPIIKQWRREAPEAIRAAALEYIKAVKS